MITLKIEGLSQNRDGTFTFDAEPVSIDYESIVELLKLAGVDMKDAHALTDEFAESVSIHTMARQLANRMSVV